MSLQITEMVFSIFLIIFLIENGTKVNSYQDKSKTDKRIMNCFIRSSKASNGTVSYTHLDVYKRQCYMFV